MSGEILAPEIGQLARADGILLTDFESYLRAECNLSPTTASTYATEVRALLDYLHGRGQDVTVATERELEEYFIARQVTGIDSRTRAKAVSAVKAFFRFLVLDRRIERNPARFIPTPKRIARLPRFLSVEEVEQLIAACDTSTAPGMRDRALYALIYSAGLRVSEALGLTMGNLSLSDRSLLVMGKGRRERRAILGGRAARYLVEYIGQARPLLLDGKLSDMLFISRRARSLSRGAAWKNLQTLALHAGVQTKVHGLRHSFATHMLDGGAGIQEIQALLGHESISSTEIYTHVSQERLREIHQQFLPRAKSNGQRPVPDWSRKEEAARLQGELPSKIAIPDLVRRFGVSRTRVDTLIGKGWLKTTREGWYIFVTRESLIEYVRDNGVPKPKTRQYGRSSPPAVS